MKYSYSKITSISNPLIKEAIKIKKRHNIQSSLLFAEGVHLVYAAALSKLTSLKTVFVTDHFVYEGKNAEILALISSEKAYIVTEKIFSILADTESPQGIAAVVDYNVLQLEQLQTSNIPLFVVCDAVRDPGNIGAIIRAADAFGADGVIVLPESCDPFNPKALRSSAGSLFNIPVVKADQDKLMKYFKLLGIRLYATSLLSENSISRIDMQKPLAIAFGNEAAGVRETLLKKSAGTFRIPIIGKAESLNVAMSASISLYEVMRQRA